jgi:hypothetical protein
MYTSNRREAGGQGWSTDYPDAERNFSKRLAELTKMRVSKDPSGEAEYIVVHLTDADMMQCAYISMEDAGTAQLTDAEVVALRTYLLKGGFLWVDDFWGSYAWDVWESEIRKVFPATDFPIVDLSSSHPIFHTLFDLTGVPQIPGIGTWLSGRGTSERGADSAVVHSRAIADAQGRVMVFMTHNTDVSDSWEREGEDPGYFYKFSIDGYRVAVNVLIYAMTH